MVATAVAHGGSTAVVTAAAVLPAAFALPMHCGRAAGSPNKEKEWGQTVANAWAQTVTTAWAQTVQHELRL